MSDINSIICFLGGDQIVIWEQTLTVNYTTLPLEHAKLMMELYNRFTKQYEAEDEINYIGLDNLAEEVLDSRRKMVAEMNPEYDYGDTDPNTGYEFDSFYEFIQCMLEQEKNRYGVIQKYFNAMSEDLDGQELLTELLMSGEIVNSKSYYWINQAMVSETEYQEKCEGMYMHWYDIAELFSPDDFPIDFSDPDTVSIFGTGKFISLADLSFGC